MTDITDILNAARQTQETKDNFTWSLSKLAVAYSLPHNNHFVTRLKDFASEINISFRELRKTVETGLIFEESFVAKFPHLGFNYFLLASKLENPKEMIILANDNNWTLAQFSKEIKKRKLKIKKSQNYDNYTGKLTKELKLRTKIGDLKLNDIFKQYADSEIVLKVKEKEKK